MHVFALSGLLIMARLSKEQWAAARERWESDSLEGFSWLADELLSNGVYVSRVAISKYANRHGWEKFNRLCLLSFDYAAIRNSPVVYAIGDRSSGKWVYVGKTIKPSKRFDNYKYPSLCHNPALADWLSKNEGNIFVEIVHFGRVGIDDAEKKWIKRCGDSTFNIASGGEQSWRKHNRKPWMAGIGIMPPSSLAICREKDKSKRDKIREIIGSMSDIERVSFEVSLAMDLLNLFPLGSMSRRINLWLDRCSERLIDSLSPFEKA
jgi:hypothetical protein